jgi:molybdopterin-guanine dinucleotide biosynthesis protein A
VTTGGRGKSVADLYRQRWSGAVLTGGRSERMGHDKALLRIDGEAMAVRAEHALKDAGAVEVACIGGDLGALRALGLVALDDEFPNAGPLGGVLTAMAWAREEITVVTPCDFLMPEAQAFRDLVAALVSSDAMAAMPIVDGQWRPLPAAVRTRVRPALFDVFARGERAVHRAMERLDFVAVDVGVLADADTPEDLPGHR